MDIVHVRSHKKAWLPLLLVGDESEAMIDRYLDRGELFVLHDPDARGLCVVTREGEGVAEIKNLAVAAPWRRRGYGKALIEFVCARYASSCHSLQLGTGEVPSTLAFYRTCGFMPFDAARQNSPGECVITSGTSDCMRCKKIAKAGQVPAFFVSPVVVWGMAGLACAGA